MSHSKGRTCLIQVRKRSTEDFDRNRVPDQAPRILIFRCNLLSVLVNGLANIESSQNRTNRDEQVRHGKLLPSTRAPSKTPSALRLRYIWVQDTVLQETFWIESLWIGIDAFVMHHGPELSFRTIHKNNITSLTHQAFPITIAPDGIRWPLYMSSVLDINKCGTAIGNAGLQRRISWMTALMYGSDSLSEKSGKRSCPMTLSSSSWQAFCTSGWRVIARKNVPKTETA